MQRTHCGGEFGSEVVRRFRGADVDVESGRVYLKTKRERNETTRETYYKTREYRTLKSVGKSVRDLETTGESEMRERERTVSGNESGLEFNVNETICA